MEGSHATLAYREGTQEDDESRTEEELAARSAKEKAKEEEDQSKALTAIGLRVSPEFLGIITDA
jgi:F0F1-type ATP synthase assembly protein I